MVGSWVRGRCFVVFDLPPCIALTEEKMLDAKSLSSNMKVKIAMETEFSRQITQPTEKSKTK
jgi:hypothetical protein